MFGFVWFMVFNATFDDIYLRNTKLENIIKMKNKKIPHCWNNSKIKYQNCRKRQNQYTNIWPLTFLAWYTHFNKSGRVKLYGHSKT